MRENPDGRANSPLNYLPVAAVAILIAIFVFSETSPSGRNERYTDSIRVMGTEAHVLIINDGTVDSRKAAEAAFDAMRQVDRLMSSYNPSSDISKLMQAKAGETVPVSEDTWNVIMESLRFNRLTSGAFDITVGPYIDLYDYKSGKMDRLPPQSEIEKARAFVGSDKIIFEREGMKLALKVKGMKIKLGAIAKGYAVDKAMEAVKAMGVKNAFVEAGGEIRVTGTVPLNDEEERAEQKIGDGKDGKEEAKGADKKETKLDRHRRLWRIAIRNPRNVFENIEQLELSECAIATSGDYEQNFKIGGKIYSHIIHPDTGLPVTGGVVSATVVLPTDTDSAKYHRYVCMKADALATSFSVMGAEKSKAFVKKFKHDFRLEGIRIVLFVLTDSGTLERVVIEDEEAPKAEKAEAEK